MMFLKNGNVADLFGNIINNCGSASLNSDTSQGNYPPLEPGSVKFNQWDATFYRKKNLLNSTIDNVFGRSSNIQKIQRVSRDDCKIPCGELKFTIQQNDFNDKHLVLRCKSLIDYESKKNRVDNGLAENDDDYHLLSCDDNDFSKQKNNKPNHHHSNHNHKNDDTMTQKNFLSMKNVPKTFPYCAIARNYPVLSDDISSSIPTTWDYWCRKNTKDRISKTFHDDKNVTTDYAYSNHSGNTSSETLDHSINVFDIRLLNSSRDQKSAFEFTNKNEMW